MASGTYRTGRRQEYQSSHDTRRVVQIPPGMEGMVLGNPILAGFLVEKNDVQDSDPETLVKCLDIIIQIQGAAEKWAGFVMRNEFTEQDALQKIHDVIYESNLQSEALFSILNQYAQDTFCKTLRELRKYQLQKMKSTPPKISPRDIVDLLAPLRKKEIQSKGTLQGTTLEMKKNLERLLEKVIEQPPS